MRPIGQRTAGFTVVEVLVAVTVAGTLAALAIPTFVSYRQRSYDARAVHDLGNAAAAEAAYYADRHVYKAVPRMTGKGDAVTVPPGFTVSDTVTIEIVVQGDQFKGTATSSKGSGKTYTYDSVSDTLIGD